MAFILFFYFSFTYKYMKMYSNFIDFIDHLGDINNLSDRGLSYNLY